MQPWKNAWMLGTISGLSLPIGAVLGVIFTPVRDQICAAWMALGAGALLFAVTIELYGHALRELELGRADMLEMLATVGAALVGAYFYLYINRWLDRMMEESFDDHFDEVSSPLVFATETSPLQRNTNVPSPLGGDVNGGWGCSGSFARQSTSEDYASIRSRGRDRIINKITTPSLPSLPDLTRAEAYAMGNPQSGRPQEAVDAKLAHKSNKAAFALFLGILVDGVPEGILMGFLAAEEHLSYVLILSLLVANFPEAFSSASLMKQGGNSITKIVSLWVGLCLLVGALAGAACFVLKYCFPTYPRGDSLPHSLFLLVAVVEGLTGGAMIACIATVMLPEAFQRAGKDGPLVASSGFLCTAGFLVAVVMKALEHDYNNRHSSYETHDFYLPGYGFW